MNVLDSRFLRIGDSYSQKFSKPGRFRYAITHGGISCISIDEFIYNIIVKPITQNDSKPVQHNVIVQRAGKSIVALPTNLEINQGDMVLWYTTDTNVEGFAVVSESEHITFSSLALTNEAVYSHAFGNAGTYKWIDTHKGKVNGVIIVKNFESIEPNDCKEFLNKIGKGAIINVVGDRVEPIQIEIITGQTVFWIIEKAKGISITDSIFAQRMVDK